ncbi:carbohydrate-binding module family 50 protein [Trichoderma barbatum]
MADRSAPGVSSPHQSSSSSAPLAGTTGSGSVRSRNRRPPNLGNGENLTRSHGDLAQRTQNAKGREGTSSGTPGLGQVLGDSWAQSWSSVQGFASSLLSVAESPGDMSRPQADNQSDHSFASSLWNRTPPSSGASASRSLNRGSSPALQSQRAVNRVAAGSSDQREAALKTAQRASVLENSQGPNGGLDVSGKYKRRNSDEITSENSQPEEYLVYIHKVLPIDTYAGIILRYKCMEDAFRKANGLWSRDSIQVRKWLIIPVDACEVRGRPCEPPSGNQNHDVTDFFEATTTSTTGSMAPQTASSGAKLSSKSAAQEDENAEKEAMPWSHVRWVKIDSLPEPVEIGRIARQKMGYFPPRRKKAVSFSSTPRQSLDAADQIEQPLSRRQSSVGDQPPSQGRRESFRGHGDGDGPDMRPAWMRRSGGVGSLSRNIRAPGPDKDYLNSWAKKHFPGLNIDDLPSMSVMGSEMARFGFDREAAGIAEGTIQESDTESPHNQNNGLDKAAAAVETWLRTAWSKRSMAPLIPGQRSSGGQDFGDLIELTPTPGAEGTPRLDMFGSQIPSPFLGSIVDADSSIKRSG